MCLAIPVRIVRIEGETAVGEVGGVEREVSLVLTPEAKVGDYVIVHAGFAIQILDRQAAEETRQIFDRMAQAIQERRQKTRKSKG